METPLDPPLGAGELRQQCSRLILWYSVLFRQEWLWGNMIDMLQNRDWSLSWWPSSTSCTLFVLPTTLSETIKVLTYLYICLTLFQHRIYKFLWNAYWAVVSVPNPFKQCYWVFVWSSLLSCFGWSSHTSIARVTKPWGVNGVDVLVHVNSKTGHQLSTVVTTIVGWCCSPFGFR